MDNKIELNSKSLNKNSLKELKSIYLRIKNDIEIKLDRFTMMGKNGSDTELFIELVFCLMTPQSKAKVCWGTAEDLVDKNILFTGSKDRIANELKRVRFKNTKAENIIRAREMFSENGKIAIKSHLKQIKNVIETREWLVENVLGMGYKEASHFLRNIGCGEKLAILDRHILKNLKAFQVIDDIPKSISKKKYIEIEKKMIRFADRINIPLAHLDLLLWYKETGEVFK